MPANTNFQPGAWFPPSSAENNLDFLFEKHLKRAVSKECYYKEYNHPVFQMLLRSGYDARTVVKTSRRLRNGCLKAFRNHIKRRNSRVSFRKWSHDLHMAKVVSELKTWSDLHK